MERPETHRQSADIAGTKDGHRPHKTETGMTGHQCHFRQLSYYPGTDDQAAAIRILDLLDQFAHLVNVCPSALSSYATACHKPPKIALRIGPFVL